MFEAVTNTVTTPQLIQAAISGTTHIASNAFIVGLIGFFFWRWKRTVTKSEEEEAELGGVIYDKDCKDCKSEHDEKADTKHDEVMHAFSEQKANFDIVHTRITRVGDDVGKLRDQFIGHLEHK